jgi:hypothetical protein
MDRILLPDSSSAAAAAVVAADRDSQSAVPALVVRAHTEEEVADAHCAVDVVVFDRADLAVDMRMVDGGAGLAEDTHDAADTPAVVNVLRNVPGVEVVFALALVVCTPFAAGSLDRARYFAAVQGLKWP